MNPKKNPHFQLKLLFCSLTDDVQLHEEAPDGLRADLALVPPRVPRPHVLDLQDPLLLLRVVDRLVAHVRSVRVPAHRQDVKVVVADPGDLKEG